MYNPGTAPCSALRALITNTTSQQNSFYNDAGWKTGVPWLYYERTGTQVLYNKNRVQVKMTLSADDASSSRYAHIPFKLAKYSLEGDFEGWEDMSNQILMCPVTIKDSERYRRVGLALVEE